MIYRFANPEFLWLLLLLPLLALWLGRRGHSAAVQYPTVETVRRLGSVRRTSAGAWLTALRLFALAFLIFALARPQRGNSTQELNVSGIDMILAVDVSGSMQAMDYQRAGQQISRLELVKDVVGKFVEARPNDRIGLVAFGGRPFLVSPLTLDHDYLLQNLSRLNTGFVEDSTAIGSGLASSVNRLRDTHAKSKIVVLLTDGVNNTGKIAPLTAAEAAQALGVKVYTIAAGSNGPAPLPITDQFGQRRIVMIPAEVDEKTLRAIADMTGGRFYRAADADSLVRIYAEIDKLEKTTQTLKKYEHYTDLFVLALIPAFLFLGVELGLSQTRFQRLP
jgi:Ca-activated chloride channel family protein